MSLYVVIKVVASVIYCHFVHVKLVSQVAAIHVDDVHIGYFGR
jgi:hypothetical protein